VNRRAKIYVGAVVFSAMGLFLIVGASRNYRRGKQSLNWPKTRGIILTSNVEDKTRARQVGGRVRGRETYYEARVRYAYKVEGKEYESTWTCHKDDRSDAVGLAATRRSGDRLDVFYDPDNPERAALERWSGGGDLQLIRLGIGLLVLGGLLFTFGKRLAEYFDGAVQDPQSRGSSRGRRKRRRK
jgi:uncharacterized protein DUF3592